jgi:hypothetical protein
LGGSDGGPILRGVCGRAERVMEALFCGVRKEDGRVELFSPCEDSGGFAGGILDALLRALARGELRGCSWSGRRNDSCLLLLIRSILGRPLNFGSALANLAVMGLTSGGVLLISACRSMDCL